MSSASSSTSMGQGGPPEWSAQAKLETVRKWFRVLVIMVVLLWLILIGWVLVYAPITKAPATPLAVGASLTIVLAPVLAAAAAVERTLETVFNVLEGSWHTMVAYLGRGLSWLKSAETEVTEARQFLADISDKYSAELQDIHIRQASASALTAEISGTMEVANRMMGLAQQRLADAESNLAGATSSSSYVSAKAAASIVVGLMLGVIIAAMAQMQMFAMLGIGAVHARIDVLVTGLVIGTGSYPVHSLVGILQQGKDTLDSVKGYYNRSAPTAQAVQQRITTVQAPTTPGEPASIQQAIVETTTAKSTDDGPHK